MLRISISSLSNRGLNGTINENINKVLVKNNVLGRDGKILHVTTHRFRATVATNLISEGTSVDIAAQLLGQTFDHRALAFVEGH